MLFTELLLTSLKSKYHLSELLLTSLKSKCYLSELE